MQSSSISYNFKGIATVPDSTGLIDIILSKTQRKTPTVTHPGYNIQRIRRFYMRKIKFTVNSVHEKLEGIVIGFPKVEDIHPFYADLINILYDKDHYKMALGYINTGKNLCEKVAKDYIKLMKYADSLYRCKQLKVAALGRMATIMKKLNSSLKYLEEVRKHLTRLPSIDPFTRTLLLTGYPNVGKSSFMNKITTAESEVQPYPFTTKSLWAGHTTYKNIKWQVIDTPGILDRPLEERNTIEMQAITALAHLEAAVLYFIDISESCGYSLADQLKLFISIKPLFKNKPLIIVLNKIDLRSFSELDKSEREIIENAAKEHNTYLIQMSNVSNTGVVDVKTKSCDILLDYRKANMNTTKGKTKVESFANRLHIAQPTKRDNKNRTSYIPNSVVQERKQEALDKSTMVIDEDDKLKNLLRDGEDDGLERKLKRNPVKELMEANGGDGVFYVPDRQHFILEKPEWKDDVMPEIMDGKNIFDYIDPDINQKLQALEEEEEQRLLEKQNQLDNEEEDEDSDLDDELLLEHDTMMENVQKIRTKHKQVKRSTLPRKVRDLTETEKFMAELRVDKKEGTDSMKMLSNKRRRDEKNSTKKVMWRQKKERDEDNFSDDYVEDDEENNAMEINDDMDTTRRIKKKKMTKTEKIRLEKEEVHKAEITRRMKEKISKKHWKKAKVNETDRKGFTMRPVHLNTGKRGIGKTDRR